MVAHVPHLRTRSSMEVQYGADRIPRWWWAGQDRHTGRGSAVMRVATRRAVRAILLDDADRIVLLRRTRPDCPVYWVAPGGTVEPTDASLEAALQRELAEELGARRPVFPGIPVQHRHRYAVHRAVRVRVPLGQYGRGRAHRTGVRRPEQRPLRSRPRPPFGEALAHLAMTTRATGIHPG